MTDDDEQDGALDPGGRDQQAGLGHREGPPPLGCGAGALFRARTSARSFLLDDFSLNDWTDLRFIGSTSNARPVSKGRSEEGSRHSRYRRPWSTRRGRTRCCFTRQQFPDSNDHLRQRPYPRWNEMPSERRVLLPQRGLRCRIRSSRFQVQGRRAPGVPPVIREVPRCDLPVPDRAVLPVVGTRGMRRQHHDCHCDRSCPK
jgi:hypothetical protein